MNYRNLFLMTGLSFITMYILMYLMVDNYSNVYLNLNQGYMAGIMTIPMLLFELCIMRSMYTNKRLNALIVTTSLIVFVALIVFVRRQTSIYDTEFLKSMIPHHAAAILMCKKAQIYDSEIKELCRNIHNNQQSEIDFMKAKLEALQKK